MHLFNDHIAVSQEALMERFLVSLLLPQNKKVNFLITMSIPIVSHRSEIIRVLIHHHIPIGLLVTSLALSKKLPRKIARYTTR